MRMAILVACGNSICGNSAIAAVAPVIGADGDDIASSISFTAVLGVIVVLTCRCLVPVLNLSLTQYGVLAGLTVYAVPQVLAATLPIGELSNQVGTVIKLVRVLMLGPVVLGFSLFASRLRPASAAYTISRRRRLRLTELVPWFIIRFLAALAIRSLGLIPDAASCHAMTRMAEMMTTVAMAAWDWASMFAPMPHWIPRDARSDRSLIVLGFMSYGLIDSWECPMALYLRTRSGNQHCRRCVAFRASAAETRRRLRGSRPA